MKAVPLRSVQELLWLPMGLGSQNNYHNPQNGVPLRCVPMVVVASSINVQDAMKKGVLTLIKGSNNIERIQSSDAPPNKPTNSLRMKICIRMQ